LGFSYGQTNKISTVVTTIVSLVHAAFIISKSGIHEVIAALVEDCMSLTVANLPVVATASFRHLASDSPNNDDGDGQRWSTWKFKTRTLPPHSTATGTTFFSTPFGATAGGDADAGTTVELTRTALEQSKQSKSMGIGEYSLDSMGPDDMFANSNKSVDDGRREDKGGVVRIDVLPYEREPSPKP
jgi:hypothetical protein